MANPAALLCFHEEKTLSNALGIFLLTTLFYLFGASLRLVDELSLFWPLNGIMAGVFARHAFLNRPLYYAICYVAMLAYDAVTTTWGFASLAINLSNLIFIVTVAMLVLRDKARQPQQPQAMFALRLFAYCLLAALLCALCGALGSVGIDKRQFMPLYADWFSEQFSTGVLLVPWVLTLRRPRVQRLPAKEDLWPLLALLASLGVSVLVGGAGSLTFPLAGLIWCALRYSFPVSAFITFCTGVAEIVLVAYGIIDMKVDSPLGTNQMFSTRLGIATLAICPLIVGASVAALNTVMQQVARRADYDHLTGVYSRSGLYEALGRHASPPSTLCVLLIDIDYFKSINDSYGHECGDAALATFGERLQALVGTSGLVARMGGEEFVIMRPGITFAEGLRFAETLRTTIASQPFRWLEQEIHLTVSIGMGYDPAPVHAMRETFDALMREADGFLYQSKNQGRNQTSSRQNGWSAAPHDAVQPER